MTNFRLCRPHVGLNVIAKPGETVHQFGGILLSQATGAYGFSDLYHQARLNLELFGISQTKVGKHVARTTMYFNAFNLS